MWKRFPEEDVLRRVSAAEEHIREMAIGLSTAPFQLTWGQALRRAARELSYHWEDVYKELQAEKPALAKAYAGRQKRQRRGGRPTR